MTGLWLKITSVQKHYLSAGTQVNMGDETIQLTLTFECLVTVHATPLALTTHPMPHPDHTCPQVFCHTQRTHEDFLCQKRGNERSDVFQLECGNSHQSDQSMTTSLSSEQLLPLLAPLVCMETKNTSVKPSLNENHVFYINKKLNLQVHQQTNVTSHSCSANYKEVFSLQLVLQHRLQRHHLACFTLSATTAQCHIRVQNNQFMKLSIGYNNPLIY